MGGNCLVSLGISLKGQKCQPYNSDVALRITLPSPIRVHDPDLQIVCESNDGDEPFQDKPVVVIEILSDSTRRFLKASLDLQACAGWSSVIPCSQMHLRFTDEELATLVEMVSLATEMANMNPNDEGNAGFARFENIENKVLEAAKNTGMAEIIEYDVDRGKNRVTEEFQEGSFFQQCFDEFRNAVFWEELMVRLADRDLTRELGEATYLAMDEEERRKRLEPIEKNYWVKFQREGMTPLFWIDHNEDA